MKIEVSSQTSRLISLESNAVLYRAGDSTDEIYIVKDGLIEMRVNLTIPKKSAEFCPQCPNHSIPSVLIAVLSQSSVVNDIPELLQRNGLEIITNTWVAHAEECTAIAKEPTTLLAIGKASLLSEVRSQERLERLTWFVKSCTTFRWQRLAAIQKARKGMIYGDLVLHQKPEQQTHAKDLCEVIMQFRKKKVDSLFLLILPEYCQGRSQICLKLIFFQFALRQPCIQHSHRKSNSSPKVQTVPQTLLPSEGAQMLCAGRLHVKLPRQLDRRTHVSNIQMHESSTRQPLAEEISSIQLLQRRPILTARDTTNPSLHAEARTAVQDSMVSARSRILNAILSPRLEFVKRREIFFQAGLKDGMNISSSHHEFNPRIIASCQERSVGRAPSFKDPSFKAHLSPRRWCCHNLHLVQVVCYIQYHDLGVCRVSQEERSAGGGQVVLAGIPSLQFEASSTEKGKNSDWVLSGKQLRPRDVAEGRF